MPGMRDLRRIFRAFLRRAVFLPQSLLVSGAIAAGQYYTVEYPPSEKPGELKLGVSYTLWVPDTARPLRGLIVHQHGCGEGACKGGATAAYDLHWQALAKKWNCALLGPSYQQAETDNCTLWSDPRKGSELTFLKSLFELAGKCGHAELPQVPWCLWGHSGGGYWAAEMQVLHPERIVAVWLRSGASKLFQTPDEASARQLPPAFYEVPVMCNPGVKEKSDRFAVIWEGMLETFRSCRAKGAPIGFAPDPRTSHECGDSRYLAIPFFDACLGMRLPKNAGDIKLRPVDLKQAWLAPLLGDSAKPAAQFEGAAKEAVWLPNASVAAAWSEYVRTGAVADNTSPPAPRHVQFAATPKGLELMWEAEADFESGLGGFIIERDGRELARLPAKPMGRFGRPLFQTMSYHDTPERPLPEMRFLDTTSAEGVRHKYDVIAVNSVGLRSRPTTAKPVHPQ